MSHDRTFSMSPRRRDRSGVERAIDLSAWLDVWLYGVSWGRSLEYREEDWSTCESGVVVPGRGGSEYLGEGDWSSWERGLEPEKGGWCT